MASFSMLWHPVTNQVESVTAIVVK